MSSRATERLAFRAPYWWALGLAALLCLPALLPLLVIAAALLTPDVAAWSHLSRHVLPEVTLTSFQLMVGVALLSGLLGTFLAWLTAMCEFPGRRFFDWALLLPLAMPAYVLAFVAVGFLDFSGPMQSWLRANFGGSSWLPPVRSLGGAIVVLSLSFYPYVYLLARSAFLTQGRRAMEAAQTLGHSSRQAAWRVALPMARPWIAAGVALVCMETLADFGAVSIFGVNTFTTAIYRAWFGLFSMRGALQLASVLLVFVLLVMLLERYSRAAPRFASARDGSRAAQRQLLSAGSAMAAVAVTGSVFLLAFCAPLLQLVIWSVHAVGDLDLRYVGFVARSLMLASSAALLIVAVGVVLAYVQRRAANPLTSGIIRAATVGYAIPGTVLAVGILVPVIGLNNLLQDWLQNWFGAAMPSLLLHATLATLLLAYLARFLAVGFNPIDAGLQRVTSNIDEAAAGLGVSGTALLCKVHLPLLRTSVATAAILVFVDVMKEMPITLIVRPFGWDTLAVKVFEMTSEGEWERAALPATVIVIAGLVPAALLSRRGSHVA
jgi:iron(III) transport system permease protein